MIFRRAFVARCNQTARLFSWKVTVGDLSAMFRRISEQRQIARIRSGLAVAA
jgi:hypothetical protein